MRKIKIEFLAVILSLMLCVGMMTSPAGADVIGSGINEIHFYNYETLFVPDGTGGYTELDLTVAANVNRGILEGDIFVGIIGVQDVVIGGDLHWTFSLTDQLTGIFAQKVAEVIFPDNGVPAGNPTPSGNQYDILNQWNSQPRMTFEAPNTTAIFTTLAGETFALSLTGDEMIALYRNTGPDTTPLEPDGPIVDDIAEATDGSLWATFAYNTGVDAGMTLGIVAGDQDDTGYYYSYTSVFGTPVNNFTGESWAGVDAIQNNTGYLMTKSVNDPGEGEMDAVIARLLNDMFMSSEFEMYPMWLGAPEPMGNSPWVYASNDPAWLHVVEEGGPGQCRMTGGNVTVVPYTDAEGVATWTYDFDGLIKDKDAWITTGGQIGAPSGGVPRGHWTHAQHGNFFKFTFLSGTSSAPSGTEISTIECADSGWCVQARCAPFKQIFWTGIGNFSNKAFHAPALVERGVVAGSKGGTLHFYRAMVGDFGDNKRPTREDALVDEDPETCNWFDKLKAAGWPGPPGPYVASDAVFLDSEADKPKPLGFGDKDGQICDKCPDYYQIEIFSDTDPTSESIYRFSGYVGGGNYQIHPATGSQCPANDSDLVEFP